jgi:hypothetical protein
MSDQTRLAALSDGPTSALINSAGAVRSFATGGAVAPTEAQKEAGNYRKGHVRVHGMDLSIETPKGAKRSGKGKDGKPWSVTMPAHYGYIRGTKGADGDHVDAYLGPHPGNPNVHVVDQVDAYTGKFDEHKALIGFQSRQHALDHYNRGFSDGRGKDRVGAVTTLPAHKFRSWVEKGRRTRPLGTLRVNRTQDDPYLAGISQNHCTLDIDKRVPKTMVVKGKSFDPVKYLAVHETDERKHMDVGMKYEPAHRLALKAERAAVEADGIDWNGYQEQMHKLAGITQKEKNPHPPSDLYKGPFTNAGQRKLTREGDSAPDVKKYAEGGEVEGGYEPLSDDEVQRMGLPPGGPGGGDYEPLSDEEVQQRGLNPNGPVEYNTAGEALKRGAQAVLPGLGSIPAMIGGAEVGSLGGPIGSLAGAAVGGIAANVSLRKIQDWFMDKLGISPDPEKAAAFQQEHPKLATAVDIAGSLVGMGTGGAAVTGVQRAAMAGGQAAIEAGSEYLHTGELDPSDIAMAAAAGAAFPGLNRVGEPLGQLGSRLAAKVGIRAGRPDMAKGSEPMKALPSPPDYTVSSEGEAAAYPGGDDQVFSQAAAPRPGTPRENTRPIYEMPREDWTDITRPGTRPPDNTAPGAENDIPTKTDENITADKSAATPAHAGYDPNSTLSTSHEMAPPRKDTNIGNPQSYPAGSERDYRTTTDSNVHPTSSGAGDHPTAETLDPTTGGISQEVMQALTQDNGPGRNTPPRGLKAADKRMQKSMRVPFSGEAANENVANAPQPGRPSVTNLTPDPFTSALVEQRAHKLPPDLEAITKWGRPKEEDEGQGPGMHPGTPSNEEMHGDTRDIYNEKPLPELEARRGGEPTEEELNGVPPTPENVRSFPSPKPQERQPGELYREVPPFKETQDAYWQGQDDYRAGNANKRWPPERDDMNAAYDRGMQDAMTASRKGQETTEEKFTGPLHDQIHPKDQKAQEAYQQGHKDVYAGESVYDYPGEKKYQYAYDRGRNDARRALRENKQPIGTEIPTHPNTGIVEGAVADTAAKLRERDLGAVADAVEKNPAIEPQARKILQDLTAKIEEHGAVSPEEMKRVTRIMDKIEKKENPQEGAAQAKRESLQQQANLGEETVAAESTKVAREKQFAAQAAQSAFDKFQPTNNKIPTTVVDQDLFKRRLSDALEHAQKENLGKDPLSPMPRKRTAAQEWLRAASKLVNAKRITPKMITDFMSNEQIARGGASGKEIREFNKVDADIATNKRRVIEDPIDTAMRQWTESLSPEDRAQWENEISNTSDPNGDEYQSETSAGKKSSLEDYDSQKSSGAEYYGGLLRDMFRDENASFNPQAFLASLRGVFGPKARLYAESYRAMEPEGTKHEYANSLDDGLNRVQKMEGGVWLDRQREAAAMPDAIKNNDEKIYLAHERDDIASLSSDEKAAYYQKLQPVFEHNDELFRNIEAIHPGLLGPKVENHIQRVPQGYHPDFGGDPIANVTAAKKRGLSTMTATLKHREFMALEDPQGNRTVISPTENGYAEWNNHIPAYRQNAAFEETPGVQFRDHNGVLQTVKDALTPEIEQHANFSNGQPAKYIKSAILSALATNAELRNTLARLQYLQSIKAELVARGMATPDAKVAERNGWKPSIAPQFKDLYMTDHVRAVLDDFTAPGLTSNEAWDRVRNLSEKVTKLMFIDPIFHLANVGTHWFTDRGWDWIKPEKLRVLASTSAQAIKSVLSQDTLQDTLHEHGFGGQYRGVLNQNRLQNIYTAAGHAIASNPSKWDPIARVMGMSAQDLGRAVYRASSKMMWAGNDMFLTQRVLERMHDGATMENAIMQSEKHFPNYRVPSYVIGANDWGRLASRMLRDNTLFAFGPYHYGVFNSYAHIVKDAVKGNGQERIDAAGKMFAMGLLAFAVYPALDKIARMATGNPDAEFRRRGPLTLPNHIVRAAQGKEDALNTGPQGTLTISPLAQGAMQQASNRDFAGRPINEPGDVTRVFQGPNRMQALGKVVTQRAASMAQNFISPYAMAMRAADNARGPISGFISQVADIKNPSPKAERYEREAAQINRQKALTRQQHGGLYPEEGLYNRLTR